MERSPFKKEAGMKYLAFAVFFIVLISGCTQPSQPIQPPQNQSGQQLVPQDYLDDALAELDQTEDISAEPVKEFNITARQWEFIPSVIEVNQGDRVILHVTSVDVTHGFWLPDFNISKRLEPSSTVTVEFIADRSGSFKMICSVFCGEGHFEMKGDIVVK